MTEQLAPPTDGGSIPTSPLQNIIFSPCSAKDIKLFVEQNHYSKTLAGANDICFRADLDGKLVGAIAYGFMGGNPKGLCVLKGYDDPKRYRELRRLVFTDEAPKNSESRLIAYSIRWIKKNTNLIALISFADPVHFHIGIVYQATNWLYTIQKQDRDRIFIDGKEIHPRSCVAKYGTSSIGKLQLLGLNIETLEREPKYRYVYILQSELRPLLKLPVHPYPKLSDLAGF